MRIAPSLICALMLTVRISCCAGQYDDLLRLCDLHVAYYKAETKIVVAHDKSLADLANLLLNAHLKAIDITRQRIVLAEENGASKLVVSEGGFAGFWIGTDKDYVDKVPEVAAFRKYWWAHRDLSKIYSDTAKASDAQILSESGVNRDANAVTLRRYIPDPE
jgi:hypothetical protein